MVTYFNGPMPVLRHAKEDSDVADDYEPVRRERKRAAMRHHARLWDSADQREASGRRHREQGAAGFMPRAGADEGQRC